MDLRNIFILMYGSFFPDKFEITGEIEEKLIFGGLFTPVLGKSAMSVVCNSNDDNFAIANVTSKKVLDAQELKTIPIKSQQFAILQICFIWL